MFGGYGKQNSHGNSAAGWSRLKVFRNHREFASTCVQNKQGSQHKKL
jgi:hypothetical protein